MVPREALGQHDVKSLVSALTGPRTAAGKATMILYPRAFAGLPLLLTCAGSAIPRAVIPAIVSTAFTAMLVMLGDHPVLMALFSHPYPYTVFANMVGFALVFRTNVAYNRYWEGISNVRTMTSKWGDAAMEVLSFDCHCKPGSSGTFESSRATFFAAACHRFSLLHALACAHLRREEKVRLFPAADLGGGESSAKERRPIRAASSPLTGECFSALRLNTSRRYKTYLEDHPLYVIGGLTDSQLAVLERSDSENRVFSEFARLLATINSRRFAGGMWVDPPAVSRIHQVLSDGMLGFQQACKLEDTPLPFPYAQVLSTASTIAAHTFPHASPAGSVITSSRQSADGVAGAHDLLGVVSAAGRLQGCR